MEEDSTLDVCDQERREFDAEGTAWEIRKKLSGYVGSGGLGGGVLGQRGAWNPTVEDPECHTQAQGGFGFCLVSRRDSVKMLTDIGIAMHNLESSFLFDSGKQIK